MTAARVLCLGIEPDVQKLLHELIPEMEAQVVSTQDSFEKSFEAWTDGQFLAIFIGPEIAETAPTELAQTVNSSCPETPKYFLTSTSTKFEPRSVIKNGANGALLLPADSLTLKRILAEKILSRREGFKDLRPVKVFDLNPESHLDFDIYIHLPLNGKQVRFAGKDRNIGQDRYNRLVEKHHNSVLVENQDLPKFYKQSADKLRHLTEGESSTEKQTKLNEAVRSIILEIYDQSSLGDFTESKKFVETCQGMISNYITKGSSSDWYRRLLNSVGDSEDVYNHAGNVSTFAALFAIAIGVSQPEELAIAGLFHDVGENALAPALLEVGYEQLSEEQKIAYQKHVDLGLGILKQKKIIISPKVEKAILQHHEKYSGKGYPKQLSGARLTPEAQILTFADQFDELTRVRPGQPRRSPAEAFDIIKQNGSLGPEILGRLERAIKESNPKKTAA